MEGLKDKTNMNKPYVKQFDSLGLEINQFENGRYLSLSPNRKDRRQHLNNKSFTGNQKRNRLIVVNNGTGSVKYFRTYQIIPVYDSPKYIENFSGRYENRNRKQIGFKTIKHYNN